MSNFCRARRGASLLAFSCLFGSTAFSCYAQGREDEVVANIASGRVVAHVTKEGIAFAIIEESAEADSIPPRVVAVDSLHLGVMLGAVEWILPGKDAKPIRLEKMISHIATGRRSEASSEMASDLETIGVAYLEALRPLAEQLHHKVELGPDEPLFELVIIGYGPENYGPEVWLYEYRMEQEALRGDYMKTRVLRPHTTQLYPPEKHEPKALVEVRYPPDLRGPTFQVMIRRNDPEVARIAGSDPRFTKVTDKIEAGQANAAKFTDAVDFLHALVLATAGKSRFALGKFEEGRGFDWIVPPEVPVEKAKEDKNRPAEAPSLMRKPKP